MKTKMKDCGCEKDVFACRAHAHPAHTPTPWFVHHNEFEDEKIILGNNGTQVAIPLGHNAAYIVKAVNCHQELLESLRECADLLNGTQEAYDNEETKQALKDAYEYIAKAEQSDVRTANTEGKK